MNSNPACRRLVNAIGKSVHKENPLRQQTLRSPCQPPGQLLS